VYKRYAEFAKLRSGGRRFPGRDYSCNWASAEADLGLMQSWATLKAVREGAIAMYVVNDVVA